MSVIGHKDSVNIFSHYHRSIFGFSEKLFSRYLSHLGWSNARAVSLSRVYLKSARYNVCITQLYSRLDPVYARARSDTRLVSRALSKLTEFHNKLSVNDLVMEFSK